jgi:uncharacterized protein (TIGR03435 family)
MLKSLLSAPVLLLAVFVVAVGGVAMRAGAQQGQRDAYAPLAGAPNATFEVASVKRSPASERGSGLYTYPGARVETHNATVRYLIAEAYDIDESQVVGGPAWIGKDDFHIEAKPPESVALRYTAPRDRLLPPPDEIRQMLQNLLAERFQLKVHVEQKNGQIYELVRNNRSLRVSPPRDKDARPWAGAVEGGIPDGKSLSGRDISMTELARWITEWLRIPVIDRTGVSGSYDFQVESESEDVGLALFDGVSQSLREVGLALKKSTGPTYKLVVDQVSQPGSD